MGTSNAGRLPVYYGWAVLFALMYIFLAVYAFVFFGASVLNVVMADDLKLPRSVLGLGFSVMTLLVGLPGPLVAQFMGRFGARGALIFGNLLVAAGCAMMATVVNNSWTFITAFGVLIGIGTAFSTAIPAQAAVTHWFFRRRAMAMSLLWAMTGVGGTIASPLLGYLVHASGNWQLGWWLICILALISIPLTAFIVKEPSADLVQQVEGGAKKEGDAGGHGKQPRVHMTNDPWTLSAALKNRVYWIIVVGLIIMSCAIICMFAYMIVHLVDQGHAVEFAAAALGLIATGEIFGMLSVGVLGQRIEMRYLWAIGMLLIAVGFFLTAHAESRTIVYVLAWAMGIGNGVALVAGPTMLGNYFGPTHFAKLYGFASPVATVVGSLSPLFVGEVFGWTHSYTIPFLGLGWVVLASAVVLCMTKPPVFVGTRSEETVGQAAVAGQT